MWRVLNKKNTQKKKVKKVLKMESTKNGKTKNRKYWKLEGLIIKHTNIKFGQVLTSFVKFCHFWSICQIGNCLSVLIKFGQYWSICVNVGQFWVNFGQCWSILVKCGKVWSSWVKCVEVWSSLVLDQTWPSIVGKSWSSLVPDQT